MLFLFARFVIIFVRFIRFLLNFNFCWSL